MASGPRSVAEQGQLPALLIAQHFGAKDHLLHGGHGVGRDQLDFRMGVREDPEYLVGERLADGWHGIEVEHHAVEAIHALEQALGQGARVRFSSPTLANRTGTTVFSNE